MRILKKNLVAKGSCKRA